MDRSKPSSHPSDNYKMFEIAKINGNRWLSTLKNNEGIICKLSSNPGYIYVMKSGTQVPPEHQILNYQEIENLTNEILERFPVKSDQMHAIIEALKKRNIVKLNSINRSNRGIDSAPKDVKQTQLIFSEYQKGVKQITSGINPLITAVEGKDIKNVQDIIDHIFCDTHFTNKNKKDILKYIMKIESRDDLIQFLVNYHVSISFLHNLFSNPDLASNDGVILHEALYLLLHSISIKNRYQRQDFIELLSKELSILFIKSITEKGSILNQKNCVLLARTLYLAINDEKSKIEDIINIFLHFKHLQPCWLAIEHTYKSMLEEVKASSEHLIGLLVEGIETANRKRVKTIIDMIFIDTFSFSDKNREDILKLLLEIDLKGVSSKQALLQEFIINFYLPIRISNSFINSLNNDNYTIEENNIKLQKEEIDQLMDRIKDKENASLHINRIFSNKKNFTDHDREMISAYVMQIDKKADLEVFLATCYTSAPLCPLFISIPFIFFFGPSTGMNNSQYLAFYRLLVISSMLKNNSHKSQDDIKVLAENLSTLYVNYINNSGGILNQKNYSFLIQENYNFLTRKLGFTLNNKKSTTEDIANIFLEIRNLHNCYLEIKNTCENVYSAELQRIESKTELIQDLIELKKGKMEDVLERMKNIVGKISYEPSLLTDKNKTDIVKCVYLTEPKYIKELLAICYISIPMCHYFIKSLNNNNYTELKKINGRAISQLMGSIKEKDREKASLYISQIFSDGKIFTRENRKAILAHVMQINTEADLGQFLTICYISAPLCPLHISIPFILSGPSTPIKKSQYLTFYRLLVVGSQFKRENFSTHEKRVILLAKTLSALYLDALDNRDIFSNDRNHIFLQNKIYNILAGGYNEELTEEIISNVFANFERFAKNLIQRYNQNSGTLEFKSISFSNALPSASMQKVEILAEETHNKDMGPCKLILTDGTKVVYKPRSMLAEKIVCRFFSECEEKIHNLYPQFLREEKKILGTYAILDKGDYGYCELLENKREENVLDTENKIMAFLTKFLLIEALGRELGISDLHYGNIFIVKQCLCIVDGEVIMIPITSIYETNLIDHANSGLCVDELHNNRVYKPSKTSTHGTILEYRVLQEKLNKLRENGNFKKQLLDILQHPDIQTLITSSRTALSMSRHRFVLISTGLLSSLLHEPNQEIAWENFKEMLEISLSKNGAVLEENILGHIKKSLIEDIKNNDVPIFFVDNKRKIYYHSGVIAIIPEHELKLETAPLETFDKFKEELKKNGIILGKGVTEEFFLKEIIPSFEQFDKNERIMKFYLVKENGKVYYRGHHIGNIIRK